MLALEFHLLTHSFWDKFYSATLGVIKMWFYHTSLISRDLPAIPSPFISLSTIFAKSFPLSTTFFLRLSFHICFQILLPLKVSFSHLRGLFVVSWLLNISSPKYTYIKFRNQWFCLFELWLPHIMQHFPVPFNSYIFIFKLFVNNFICAYNYNNIM